MLQMQLFGSTHVDTARSAALMPGELCPAPCPACGTQPADDQIEALLRDRANRHLTEPTPREKNGEAIRRQKDVR
jgi:hypothetical protein